MPPIRSHNATKRSTETDLGEASRPQVPTTASETSELPLIPSPNRRPIQTYVQTYGLPISPEHPSCPSSMWSVDPMSRPHSTDASESEIQDFLSMAGNVDASGLQDFRFLVDNIDASSSPPAHDPLESAARSSTEPSEQSPPTSLASPTRKGKGPQRSPFRDIVRSASGFFKPSGSRAEPEPVEMGDLPTAESSRSAAQPFPTVWSPGPAPRAAQELDLERGDQRTLQKCSCNQSANTQKSAMEASTPRAPRELDLENGDQRISQQPRLTQLSTQSANEAHRSQWDAECVWPWRPGLSSALLSLLACL
jgi:hypothetical protein